MPDSKKLVSNSTENRKAAKKLSFFFNTRGKHPWQCPSLGGCNRGLQMKGGRAPGPPGTGSQVAALTHL